MTKLLIADMDGTIVDSMGFLSKLGITIMVTAGVPKLFAEEHYFRTVGSPFIEQLRAWNNQQALPLCSSWELDAKRFAELYEDVHFHTCKWFPFTPFGHLLCGTSSTDWQLALVTSTAKRIVTEMTQLQSIGWDFIGGFEPGRDKRTQIRQCLEQLDLPVSACVYVGDSESDAVLARTLNMAYRFPSVLTYHELFGPKPLPSKRSVPII